MQQKTLTVPLIVCGSISIILQAVGLFSPGWMILSEQVDTDKLDSLAGTNIDANLHLGVEVQMGLWTTSYCADMGVEKICETVTNAQLEKRVTSYSGNPGVQKQLIGWLALQVLAVIAAIAAIVGLIGLFLFARASDDSKNRNGYIVTVTISWLLSAIFIMAAVGKNANDQHTYSAASDAANNLNMGVSLKFALPWATVVSGLGGGFAVAVTVMMVLYLICRERRESPGTWMQFGGGKPI